MEQNIKVLIVGSDSSVKGGITAVINRFLNYKWNGIYIELLPTYIEGNGVKKIMFFFKSLFKYIIRLFKNNFDIVHIHMSYRGSFFRKYIIVKLSRLFDKNVILHLHGSEFEKFYNSSNKLVKVLIRNIFESCDSVIVLGRNWENVVKEIAPKSRTIIFNNAVNLPDYKIQWNKDKINILFLGVLIKRKGVYELIEAIKLLDRRGIIKEKNLNFIIGGSGPEEENLKKKINEYNLNFCIEMPGWVNGGLKEELLKKSQVFILPSYDEGLPMAILEAMSYGIPIISTDVGSVSEAVIDGITGYLIRDNSPIEIGEKICEIIDENWITISENCVKKIRENFDEKVYFEKIKEIYKQVYR